MLKELIILTINWPYGNGETFFENEAPYSKNFDCIYCIPLYKEGLKRYVPSTIKVVEKRLPNKYLSGLKAILRKEYWHEIVELIKSRRFSLHNLKVLTITSVDAMQRYGMISDFIKGKSKSNVTLYSYWMASDAVASSWLKKKYKTCFITRCHRFDLYECDTLGKYIPYRKMIFENADKIYSISNDGQNYLINEYPYLDPRKIIVSKLGTNDWGENPREKKMESFVIVSCSSLIPVKRVDRMLEALTKSKKKIEWYHFGDGLLRRNLEKKIKELPENVVFVFMGAVKNTDLMKWYASNHVDLFVNFSSSEGIPVSIMEAMSFGIPVVATDVGGTREIVVNGVNGVLLPRDCSNEKLICTIERLVSFENIDLLREGSRRYWLMNYYSKVNYSWFYNSIGS